MDPKKPKLELPNENPVYRSPEDEAKTDPLVQLEKDAQDAGRPLPRRIILGEA